MARFSPFVRFCLLGLLGSLGFLPQAMGQKVDGWQVGMARKLITPSEPIWMSGYASRNRPADSTRTDLWVKAMALKDRDGHVGLILSLDLVGIGAEVSGSICHALMSARGLDRSQILINSSHTHTGPVVGNNLRTMYFLSDEANEKIDNYTRRLSATVVACAEEALSSFEPARVSFGTGQSRFGVNRRNNPEMLVPKLRFEGQLKGPVDYSVPVLRITGSDDRTVGILFGYACHATTLSDYQWSGDYPGYAQLFLEGRYPGAMAQFVAGCGADINPIPRRKPELAVSYGAALADSVHAVLGGVMEEIAPKLVTQYGLKDIGFDQVPDREALEKQVASKDRYIQSRARHWIAVLERGGKVPSTYPYPVSWWRFGGEMDLIAMGGEVVVEYALAIKRQFGGSSWVAGYSHDVMAYIPSQRIWREGGYEGATSMIYYGQPDRWSDTVEQDVLELIADLGRSVGPRHGDQ